MPPQLNTRGKNYIPGPRQKFHCPYDCAHQYEKFVDLRDHCEAIHGKRPDDDSQVCPYARSGQCKRTWPILKLVNLETHIRTHTREMKYNCSLCYRGFVDQSARKRHMKTHSKVPQRPTGFQRKVAIPSGKAKEPTAISPSRSASNPYPPQQHTPDQAHTPAPAWSGPETSMAQAAERLGLQTPSHGTASSPSSLDSTPPATPSDLWPNFPFPLQGVGPATAQVNALVGPPSIVTTQSEPLPYTHPYEFATPYQQGYRRPAQFPASDYHVPLQRNMPEAPISNTWACSPSVFGGHPTTYPSDPLSLNFPVDPFFAQMTGFPSIQSSSWTQPEMGSIFGTMDWLEYSVNSDIGHHQQSSASASAMFLGFDHFDLGTGGGGFVPAGNSMECFFIWGADSQTFKDPLIDEDKEFMEMMRQAMP